MDTTSGTSSTRFADVATLPVSGTVPFQINGTLFDATGASSSSAVGGVGYATSATIATAVLKPGTGVSQTDAGHLLGSSSLLIDIKDLLFTPTAPSFGPAANAYLSFAYGGTVSAGGSAELHIKVNFTNSTGSKLYKSIVFDDVISAAGPFAKTFTSNTVINPAWFALSTSAQLKVDGTIEFRADNGSAPVEIFPITAELGGTPPTATFTANGLSVGGAPQDWFNQANWQNVETDGIFVTTALPRVAQQTGHRARFRDTFDSAGNITSLPTAVNVGGGVTLGTIDIDRKAGVQIVSSRDTNGISLQVDNPPEVIGDDEGKPVSTDLRILPHAVIQVGRLYGDSFNRIDAPLNLLHTVDVTNESTRPLLVTGRISSLPNRGIDKYGPGSLVLTDPNSIVEGPVNIFEGSLVVTGRLSKSNGDLADILIHPGADVMGLGEFGGGALRMGKGSHLSPGDPGIEEAGLPAVQAGIFKIGPLVMEADSILRMDLEKPDGGLGPIDGNDFLAIVGDASFLGSLLVIPQAAGLPSGLYTLANVTGKIEGLPQFPDDPAYDRFELKIVANTGYGRGGENILLSVAVPEPGIAGLALAGGALLLARRRRK